MKSFAKILALVIISIPSAYAADDTETDAGKAFDSIILSQKAVSLEFSPTSLNIRKDLFTGIECNQKNNTFNTNGTINIWAETNQLVSKIYTCDPKKFNFLRFSSEACTDAINCRKNVAQINGKSSEKLLNEIVAKDYAKNMLDQNIEVMDRLETLKRFAKEKYNIKGDKCGGRYQPPKKGGSCDLSLLDEVFVNQQENCHFGKRCFQKISETTLNFKDYKAKNVIPNLAFIVDYNEYRIDQEVEKMAKEDEDFINGLASFVSTNEGFKAATIEQRADMFLKKLENGDKYKDPILAYDFDSVSEKEKLKKTLKYRQLLKTFEGANLTASSFKAAFENYRKTRAENILIDGSCSETMDLKNICEEMTTLSKGDKVYKNSLSVEHLSSRNLSTEKDYEKFKSVMGDNFTEMDYDILVNAKRCISFGLTNEDFSTGLKFGSSNTKWYQSGGSSTGESEGPDENIVDNSRSSLASGFVGEAPAAKNESVKMLEPREAEDESAIDNSISSALANTQVATNNFANQFNQPFTPGAYGLDSDDKNEKIEKKEETSTAVTTPSVTAPADSKMTDLMKRLASAEEKVDKMKAANEEAENNRIKQKKIDEENALIKDLKGQIADLKSAKEKKETAKEISIANNPIIEQQKTQPSSYSSSFNSGLTSAPARQETAPKVVDNYDSGRSSAPAPSASSSNSRSISSAMLTSVTNSEGNKVLPSGIVLTTVDGMSSEKATQTISNKIIELNGTPFYIEEGGMVKEIIAVVKDGKVLLDEKGNPIYEKIVKGKVGDKKFAKVKDKNRAPAAITDAADLKRDQEEKMKRDRAEYLKLKNLTNGIIKNK